MGSNSILKEQVRQSLFVSSFIRRYDYRLFFCSLNEHLSENKNIPGLIPIRQSYLRFRNHGTQASEPHRLWQPILL
jgi:hypothetical protein